MAGFVIQGGAKIEIPQRDEIRQDFRSEARDWELERARGIKWIRLPILTGTAASSAITIGANAVFPIGPDQGYAWSVKRVVVDGMTTGATPDVLNMFRNATTAQPPLWQFNGNNFGYTFGKLEMVLFPGDSLLFASVGTFAATGTIRVSGEVLETPAEMLWKLA